MQICVKKAVTWITIHFKFVPNAQHGVQVQWIKDTRAKAVLHDNNLAWLAQDYPSYFLIPFVAFFWPCTGDKEYFCKMIGVFSIDDKSFFF